MPTTVIPPSLDFQVKYERTATCAIGVSVDFYNGDNWFYGETWYPDDLASEWTPISLELDEIEPIMTHVVIEVSVIVGDFVAGDGWISVDAMSFDGITGLEDIGAQAIGLYPNPASDVFFLKDVDAQITYTIYDAMGRLLRSESYQSGVDVSALPAGHYFIETATADGILRRSGFVVE